MTFEPPERAVPDLSGDERQMLCQFLEYHRATLGRKCAGVDAALLATRTLSPSNLSLLGLVRHMAEIERTYFRQVFAGEAVGDIYATAADPDADFNSVEDADAVADWDQWREECTRSRSIVSAAINLDQPALQQIRGREVSLRYILLHVLEEYTRHNGHADLLRERLDGATGE